MKTVKLTEIFDYYDGIVTYPVGVPKSRNNYRQYPTWLANINPKT